MKITGLNERKQKIIASIDSDEKYLRWLQCCLDLMIPEKAIILDRIKKNSIKEREIVEQIDKINHDAEMAADLDALIGTEATNG